MHSRRSFLTTTVGAILTCFAVRRSVDAAVSPNGFDFDPDDVQPGCVLRSTGNSGSQLLDTMEKGHPYFALTARRSIAWMVEYCVALRECVTERRMSAFDVPGNAREMMEVAKGQELLIAWWTTRPEDLQMDGPCFARLETARRWLAEEYFVLPAESLGGVRGTVLATLAVYRGTSLADLAKDFPVHGEPPASRVRATRIADDSLFVHLTTRG